MQNSLNKGRPIAPALVLLCGLFAGGNFDLAHGHIVDASPNEGLKLRNPVHMAISPDGRRAVVVCHDNSLAVIDLESADLEFENVPGTSWPGEHPIRVRFINQRCFIVNEYSNFVTEFDPVTLQIVANHAVPMYTQDLLHDPARNLIYATNKWLDEVLIYDENLIRTGQNGIPAGRNPGPMALSPDGSRLYVSNIGSWDISVVDLDGLIVEQSIYLGSAATSLASTATDVIATNHGGRTLPRINGAPLIQNDQEDIVNLVSFIDHTNFGIADLFKDLGANYSELVIQNDLMAFSGSGGGTVHLYRLGQPASGIQTIDLLADEWGLRGGRASGSKLRIFSHTKTLAIKDAETIYCANYFRDSVVEIQWNAAQNRFVVHNEIALNDRGVPITAFQRGSDVVNMNRRQSGERYFMTLAAWRRDQGDFTCSTCHTNGHTDFRFIFDNDTDPHNPGAVQGPEKHPSAFSTSLTGPFGWEGNKPTLFDFNAAALNAHDTQNGETEIHRDVAEFQVDFELLLRPEPNPYLPRNGSNTNPNAPERGRRVFLNAGCGVCHSGLAFTDQALHDVGTGRTLDTPALTQLWDKAPYLHDGRAQTLEAVLDPNLYESPDAHGTLSAIEQSAKADLIAYLNSITENDIFLPVELVALSASLQGGDVYLSWATGSETNNHGFEVQRKLGAGLWEAVGFVAGSGTTSVRVGYEFIDRGPGQGRYKYRLKQIDTSGESEFSDVVEITIGPPASFSLKQNFPNPFNPETRISYALAEPGEVRLHIFDSAGRSVRELIGGRQSAGAYSVLWDGTDGSSTPVPSGVYYYELRTSAFREVKKMILLR